MNQNITFHIQQNKGLFHGAFAIQIISIPSRKEEPITLTEKMKKLGKFSDFINQLYITDIPVTFSLRTMFHSNHEHGVAGHIQVALLVLTHADSRAATEKNLTSLYDQVSKIIACTFPDYRIRYTEKQETIEKFLRPFNLSRAHFAEIRKRESFIRLNSIKQEKPFGFSPTHAQEKPSTGGDTIYFTHPFIPRMEDYERLYRLLMFNRRDFIVSINITPTILTEEEQEALINEIAKCEGYEPNKDKPITRMFLERAKLLGQGLLDQLLRLQDAPYLMQIFLASPEPINKAIAESIGVAITHPIGWQANSDKINFQLQMGGYDILFPKNSTDHQTLQKNFQHPGTAFWGKSLAPTHLERMRFLVDGNQGACGFRFPQDDGSGTLGLRIHQTNLRPAPREISELNLNDNIDKKVIGKNTAMGLEEPISLAEKDLSQHMYIVGQTGTGKTTLLKSMILGDIQNGKGLAVIDPHGDLYEELLYQIPEERIKDVVLLNPLDMDYPVGLNLLDCEDLSQRIFVAREIKAIMHRLLHDTYGHMSNEYIGPVFYKHLQMNLLLTMSDPEDPGTLLEFYEIYQHREYWKRWLPLKWHEPLLENWVNDILPTTNYTYRPSSSSISMGDYVGSKFNDFVLDPRLRLIFGQKRSTIDLGKIMDEGKILLVNLAKGLLGESTAQFFGLVLMAKFQSEILGRGEKQIALRKPFTLYVDEFQSLATENFGLLLSEARKFGVSLVLANQFISQINDPKIMEAIFGNVGTMLAFRVGKDDAARIEPQFAPEFNQLDLSNLPNWQAVIKMTVNGQIVPPFNLTTIPPNTTTNHKTKKAIIQHARSTYSKNRAEVEKIISESLKMPELESNPKIHEF